jgi:signal transduction histidine kinase
VLEEATERTRRLTFELRPQLLDAAGLGAAIRDIADSLARDTGAKVTVRTRLTRHPPMIETLAYRTIRESLINIRKHAHAKNVTIRVTERRGELVAVISDDGRGFKPGRRSSATSTHFGVDSARARLQAAGGRFEISSVPGEGTTVEFHIPLPR